MDWRLRCLAIIGLCFSSSYKKRNGENALDTSYQVSVYCLAYNHESYIRHTLEGFVSQRTDFGFKVFVHDDASTDRTAQIITEYANAYPDIIVPILQAENQYSKGVKIFRDIILPLIDTKYIAICEGDDYWTDPTKLQKQYDYMEAHPECSLCVHNTKQIDADGADLGKLFNSCNTAVDYQADDVIVAGGSGLFHTSSVFYRTTDRRNMPDTFLLRSIGDYPLAIYLSTLGRVHYLPDVMSAYRVATPGGWTARSHASRKKQITHYESMLSYLKRINAITEHKYNEAFETAILKHQYLALRARETEWKILFQKRYRAIFKQESPRFAKRASIVAKSIVKTVLRLLHLRK